MSVARLRTPGLAALGLAAALLLTACGGSSNSASKTSGDTNGFPQGTGEITKVAPADRKPSPALEGKTVDGKQASLAQYRGKVVVLNVWGSWCDPCRREAPYLVKVANQEKAKGVQFLGLNTRDTQITAARVFEKDFTVPYPSIYDPDGKLLLRFKGNLPPQSIPSTLIIDRKGRLAVRALKPLNADDLHKALDPVVAEKS